jgi:hypothetical protein
MKKYFNFALLSAIALSSTIGFTACSSSDDTIAEETKVENNPTYDPVANTVTAQFVLNVAGGDMSTTRQSSVIVQKEKNFRGMQDARMFALQTTHPTWLAPYSGTETLKQSYDLGTLYTPSMVDNGTTGTGTSETSNNRESSSRRILELSLPLTTDAMLLYARAIPSGTDAANGKVLTNLATVTDPKDITFNLAKRIGDDATVFEHTKALAALILNRIISAEIPAQTSAYEHNGISYSDLDALKWKDLAADAEAVGLSEILKNAYNLFTTIKTGEIRAGYAGAIKSQIYYLNKSITTVINATATSKAELNAQRLAENIDTRIRSYFVGLSGETTTDFHTLGEWIDADDNFTNNSILYHLKSVSAIAATDYTSPSGKYYGVTGESLKTFPVCFNLPNGSAQLNFDSTNLFSYNSNVTSLLDKSTTDDPTKYMYPAELWYFDNSALRVSSAEKTQNNYPNGYNKWDTDEWSGWVSGENAKVSSDTRAVAVKNNINYGVSMLQTQVSLASGNSFSDNRAAIVTSESNQTFTEAQVKQIALKGVLIGGQNNQMGWNYLAKNPSTGWDHIIYDTDIPNSGKIPTEAGKEVYTLVFDNYFANGSGTPPAQNDVYVALEFQNGPNDFYGRDNLILANSTFYLVGKLAIGTKKIADTVWDSYYPVPPYTTAGASQKITRVFVQDYMATATFQIGATSLQNAFTTVPDLRSSQTSLGLSVDLKWQPGLDFGTVELGDNDWED